MQFSFTIVALVAAIANAAVIPRANVNAGLAARYYTNGVFPRESVAEVAGVARAIEEVTKRNHPRDFHVKRAGAEDPTREPKVRRATQVLNRRLHARDFRKGRVII